MFKKILLVALVSFVGLSAIAQTQDPPAPHDLKLRIVEKQYDDVSDKDGWEIKAVYPAVRLAGDIAAEEFDALAKSIVMKEVGRFKNDMKEMSENRGEGEGKIPFYLAIGYSTEHFDDEIVSVSFNISEFTGGAHPNHRSETLNFDLTKKKKIELGDLFDPGSDFLHFLAPYTVLSLHQQMRKMAGGNGNIDSDWIGEGAGPFAKNYQKWNITKSGLKFHFDAYQVAPYVMGGFEVVIPYRRFPSEIRSDAFYTAELTSFLNGNPPNWCRGGLWTSVDADFKLATVKGKKNSRAYFYGDDLNCPDGEDCRRPAYLIAGDELIVQREFEEFSCVWFQPSKGAETVGWLKSSEIETRQDISRPPTNWLGNWRYGSNDIEIKETQGGKLHVYGNAFWQGLGDNVHIGEIDFLGIPGNKVLEIGDGEDKYDCRVKLRMLGKHLIVSDNLNCGGLNVSFNGVYLKK